MKYKVKSIKTMKTFIVLLAALALTQATPEWESFKVEHEKVYSSPVEETTRFAIFQQNLKEIEDHNKKFQAGEVSWEQGVNQFTDWTKEEFLEYLKQSSSDLQMPEDTEEFVPDSSVSAPAKINWKAKGKVSKVKNQGACGSCWAFSTTGSLESQLLIHGKNLLLSEQQLVDCTQPDNHGCNGGAVPTAFNYIKAHGIEKESDYPYHAKNEKCHHNNAKSVAHVKGFTQSKGENNLKEMVGTKGPVSVYIDASPLQHYKSGVLDTSCSHNINHAVLAVGYDKQGGKDYWYVKNSWGAGWGEQGYVKMVRGKNLCAIGDWLFIPQV